MQGRLCCAAPQCTCWLLPSALLQACQPAHTHNTNGCYLNRSHTGALVELQDAHRFRLAAVRPGLAMAQTPISIAAKLRM